MKYRQGKCAESWTEAQQGLELFSHGDYPGDRLDQFYAVMWQCARDAGFLYTAEALLHRTIVLREDPQTTIPKNPFREGMLHFHLANILAARGEDSSANKERELGWSRLAGIPEKDIPELKNTTEIEPAELLLKHGDAERALSILKSVQDQIDGLQDHFVVQNFYRVLGNAYWHSRRLDDAAGAYRHATDIADSTLKMVNPGRSRLEWLRATQECYRGWIRVLLEQNKHKDNKQEDALRAWEWYQDRSTRQGPYSQNLRAPVRPVALSNSTITSIPRLPWSTGTRVIYAPFPDGLQIWAYQGKQIIGSVWQPVAEADLTHDLQEFTELCSTPDSSLDDVLRQSLALYRRLIDPIVSYLPPSGVITVELDQEDYRLPIEALKSPEGWYLAEKYSVVYSPGVWFEQTLRVPRLLKRQERFLLMNAAADLAGKEAERKSIEDHFPGAKMVLSKSELMGLLPNYEIFHFMGHGKSNGAGTKLVLANGDLLQASDFRGLRLSRIRLAVLEACSTEFGKNHGLLDPDSLVQSFLASHATNVIATRWEVDSRATSLLMSSFYSSLANDGTAALALLEARKAVLTKQPHPYFWAGFSLTGRAK